MDNERRSVLESVDRGLCSFCGACIAVCPTKALGLDVEYSKPKLIGECRQCSLCIKVCPQLDLEPELFNVDSYPVLEGLEARLSVEDLRQGVQDGGATTAIAIAALEEGLVDAVIATSRDDVWRPVVVVARGRDDVLRCRGSVYTYSPVLSVLRIVAEDPSIKRVMVIGLPCHARAIEKMRRLKLAKYVSKVSYVVSLFCMHNHSYDHLKALAQSLGLDLAKVSRMFIRKGVFVFRTVDGEEKSMPIDKTFEGLRQSCLRCPEFVSRYSDLSIGSIGSAEGWNTIMVSTEKGRELVEVAKKRGLLEAKPLSEKGMKLVKKFMSRKIEEAKKRLEMGSS